MLNLFVTSEHMLRKSLNPIDWFKLFKESYQLAQVRTFLLYGFKNNKDNFLIKDAGVKGKGLFSKKAFKKGGLVFLMDGPTRFFKAETPEECYIYPDWYSVGKNIWIEPAPFFNHINHSCNPNLGLRTSREFVARRDIEPGEELNFDYSSTDDELPWVMNCSCGEASCRKEVGAIQLLSEQQYERLLPYVPKYFQTLRENYLRGKS